MRRLPLAALALAAAACGDFSNDPLEDLVFVEALPSADELALTSPGDGDDTAARGLAGTRRDALSACSGDSPDWMFCLGHELTRVVNGFTHQTLWIVDTIRQLPPSERGPDFRAWGPYPDDEHPGRRWRFEVARDRGNGEPRYAWKILLYPVGEESPLVAVEGEFTPGPGGTSRGVGSFTWDGRAARARGLAGANDPDELAMTYDLTAAPARIGCRLTGADGNVVDFENEAAADRAGGWSYAVNLAVDDDGSRDDLLEVRARWDADRAGRADARLTVESDRIPPGPWAIRECWGPAPGFGLVYYDNEVQPEVCGARGCPLGFAMACRFPALF